MPVTSASPSSPAPTWHHAEAVFVAADPPRSSTIALWHPDGVPDAAGDDTTTPIEPVELVLPAGPGGRSVRTRTVMARMVPMAEAIPWLVHFNPGADPAATSPTLAAWVVAFRLGTDLVARGRLYPGIADSGSDTWRVGPLDPADIAHLDALAALLPAAARAVPVRGHRPLAIADAVGAVTACWDAIADTLVRTAAAEVISHHPAFAAIEAVPVADQAAWLASTARGLHDGDGARPVLRLELPADDESDTIATIQLRSERDPSLVLDAADLWDAPAAVLDRLGEDAETDLLLALRRGATVWPPLRRVLDEARPTVVAVDDAEAADLFGPVADDLRAAGFEVLWPAQLTTGVLELRAVISTPAPAAVAGSGLDLNQILTFDWQASMGGTALTPDELHTLAEAKRPIVRLRGQWIAADPALIAKLRARTGTMRAADALAAALSGTLPVTGTLDDRVTLEATIEVEGILADLAQRLRAVTPDAGSTGAEGAATSTTSGISDEVRRERAGRSMPEPPGLNAELRPYQRRGLAWLVEMTELGLGGCLADDMGLGKTIQLIALHLYRHAHGRSGGPTLVVCPTSLLGNWERELNRFAPGVPVRRYHGGSRHLDDLADNEVVLVTYGVVRRDHEALGEAGWGLVVADEAQHIKNPLARSARALRMIPAGARLALTGTPVENRLTELWAILDWTTPGLLGTLESFRENIAIPVERHRDPDATERLARLVRPFLLRRRKIDPGIAPELPPKTETDQVVPLTPEQATLYEAVVRETMAEIESAEGISRRGLVLKLLTALKQITDHPALYLNQTQPLSRRSGKLDALDELLEVIVGSGDSVLLFTQYVRMGRLLQDHLAARGTASLFLHGRVPATDRQDMVDRFQAGEVPVFLLSLKAGGTGLNLTRATHVIHYDRWWNPAVEDQATDRAYRIGQDRPVQVHRLITEGTVEDRIATLLRRKRDLADAVVGAGEGWIGDLTNDELADLVRLS